MEDNEQENASGTCLHRVRENVREHDLELVETGVRSELPLEVLSDVGERAEDVGERSSVSGVCLGEGVGASGGGVGIRVVEDDYSS